MPSPNPPRRPPGLPGVAPHERTPTERTATQEMMSRQAQAVTTITPRRYSMISGDDQWLHALDASMLSRVPPPSPDTSRFADLRLYEPRIDTSVVDDASRLLEPKAVIERAIEQSALNFGIAPHAVCANEERELSLHWYGSASQRENMEYAAKEMKRVMEARVGHDIIEKCGVQYEHDYNRLRASCEMVLFTRKEFDNFVKDLTANVIAAVKRKGYIK